MYKSELRGGFYPERGIIAISDIGVPAGRIKLGAGVRPVMLSDSRRARRILRGCADAVCCGTSPQDTLTVSSLTPERSLLAVQREITALDGQVIEPCEIAVTGGENVFSTLIVSAVLILCGCPISDGLVIPQLE